MEPSSQKVETIPPAVLDSIIPAAALGLSRLGWAAPAARVSFEQWAAIIDAAMAVERASPWWIGDLFVYAQAQGKDFEDRALNALPLRDQTVRNYAVVARAFPVSQRRGALSIKHHATVIVLARESMEEAQRWLGEAEREEWSATELDKHVHPALPAPADALQASETEPSANSDIRDALLAAAAEIIGGLLCDCDIGGAEGIDWKHDDPCPTTVKRDWLTRYETFRKDGGI